MAACRRATNDVWLVVAQRPATTEGSRPRDDGVKDEGAVVVTVGWVLLRLRGGGGRGAGRLIRLPEMLDASE